VIVEDQLISLHDRRGVLLYQFLPGDQISVRWNREQREVSTCELSVRSVFDNGIAPELFPFVHEITVWDARTDLELWSGPIFSWDGDETSMNISGRDIGVYLSRTRTPLTKRWDAAQPVHIAAELWRAMIESKGLRAQPIVRIDPDGSPFDFSVTDDEQALDAVHKELVGLGLRWCVVGGVPVLGPPPRDPVAVLSNDDFLDGQIRLTRDGSQTFNDILTRSGAISARTRVPLPGGVNLETIVEVDSLSSVSNIDRAGIEFAKHTAAFRDTLTLPGGSRLRPDADVDIHALIPGSRLVLSAFGIEQLVELDTVSVEQSAQDTAVSISVEPVVDLPELAEVASMGVRL